MADVLIVDDSETIRNFLNVALTRNGHHTIMAASGEEAIERMREYIFDVAIVDIKMGKLDGIDVLKVAKDISSDTEIIMLTGYGTVDVAVQAMKLGAYDFVAKPVNMEALLLIVDRALEKKELTDKVRSLQTQVREKHRIANIIGRTPAMLTVFELIEKVCQVNSPVLITGESGTGKEMVAYAIYANSQRSDKRFIPVNCAAIPEALHESEFFGHVKGAFTGAIKNKKGLFEEADGGTVFLDEIVDASLPTQAKLLRFLENGEIRRVGDSTPIYVDVRLIFATNRDPLKAVEQKILREDLYYRINVIGIHLPPLRERKDDIPLLVQHFIKKYAHDLGKDINKVSDEALSLLMEYDWPGNVRELQNVIQRAIALAYTDTISPELLPSYIRTGGNVLSQTKDKQVSLRELEKTYILQTLEKYSWNYVKAAEALGIGKATIYRKLKEYGFTRPLRSP